MGSNPHSYGDLFSRSMMVFFDTSEAIVIIKITIMEVKLVRVKRRKIDFPGITS